MKVLCLFRYARLCRARYYLSRRDTDIDKQSLSEICSQKACFCERFHTPVLSNGGIKDSPTDEPSWIKAFLMPFFIA